MDRDEIAEYVRRCQQLIESSPQMDEENTKVKLVQPFLELLGWDLYSTEVALEYTIPMASGSTHVDYALLVGDSPVVFVEAKPVRSALTDDEIQQLRSYMRQELDVDWGVLTNGKSFEVLTKNRAGNGGEEVSVVRFDLDDLAENPDVLELLTKESIRSGKSDEIAAQVAETNRAIRYLRENEDSVTEAVADAVENEVGELTISLDEQSREFVQNLASVLEEQRHFVSEEHSSQSSQSERSEQSEIGSTDGPDNPDDIEPIENRVAGTIARADIDGDPDAKVAVFPTRESGLPFLKENEAWGFVRVGSEFDYVAMYVTGDVREVRYIARADEVVAPDEADLMREPLNYKDRAKIAEDKRVVTFETGSLYELEDPIPYESKYPQGLRYTTLGELRNAETTDDML
ncbi:type I restriction enzyme HsdR N-terminal domain-containing protein [Halorhabdus tiamatea]|uniref:Restriction endonuclease n=1 Tax=Halorhabdus tiamatea SARL4B TaxID=1033806 RepID=F7PKW0_9EURY|nr:type I restriction enzyme HsdR N-terminal domain-containing protein [Halorhabdus tiamatea]CCQ34097.1 restriction endonuclease [Halorhabdus tiamatea SARL4B]